MAISVTMPRLGESVSEGTVTRWLKQEGDRVEADQPLLEVSPDKVGRQAPPPHARVLTTVKVATESPSPAAGVLKTIKVGEDETVEVGSELAVIEDGASAAADEGGGDQQQAETEEPAKAEE